MQLVYRVEQVRAAEHAAMAAVGPDALMQNAAFGLAVAASQALQDRRGNVVGSRVVVLAGAGNNGGDALWAGSLLAARGASVIAIAINDQFHRGGAQALTAAGGRMINANHDNVAKIIAMSDLVLDGILGIGGRGALRSPASDLAQLAHESAAMVVAVDLPSGVDADTGAVADPDAVVTADLTVTFGCLKPGLLVAPGSDHVGALHFVDIGLDAYLSQHCASVLGVADVAASVPPPGEEDNKYTRGVVGVVAGSSAYPGAAVLCTGAARLGGAGMVRYAGGAPDAVAAHWPEVVLADGGPANAGRVQAWVAGPGAGTDGAAYQRMTEVLASSEPVVLDADALTLLAEHVELRTLVRQRHEQERITVVTPHEGEFARLGFELPTGAAADRVGSVCTAARELGAIVLLKGHHTVIADPLGAVFINTVSDSTLATAGSGDVLSGILGSVLASDVSKLGVDDDNGAAFSAACAAFVHGTAGILAASNAEPVTALTVLNAIPDAIASIRHDGSHG